MPQICRLLIATLLVTRATLAVAEEPTDEQAKFFETKVRPVLVARCYECHGPESDAEGKLRVDSLSALLAGGTLGPAVKPGDAKGSLLVSAINHGEFVQMPPKSKLPQNEIADLTAWVAAGAAWPGATALAPAPSTSSNGEPFAISDDDRQFWAFRAPLEPSVPVVADGAWPKGPLDHFVLSALEAKGLRPAPAADKRTLLRRVTFDLHGLPPTAAEVEAFLADTSSDALAKVVDRLLASPRYGERWGRRWLDVARYADSNGMDENMAMAHAWRYRDWVIGAFNRDLPYDQFVTHQIAGDLLPGPDEQTTYDRLIATGFLVLGPKMLAEDDPVKMEMDIIDEQVDTIGRTFLGLTLGCARCHDHKFDPVPTADYYSLAGIFKSTKSMENHRVVAMWSERSLAPADKISAVQKIDHDIAETRRQLKTAEDALAALPKQGDQTKEGSSRGLGDHLLSITQRDSQQRSIASLKTTLAELERARPELPSALAVVDREGQNLRVHLRGSHITLGSEVPRRFPRILAGEDQQALSPATSGRLELAQWLSRADHPLTSRVMVNRVWLGHFGEGLVRTPDNFGKLGQQPDNQPLLDWLSRRFVESGWSIKALHRLIILSSAYQMSTTYDAQAAASDPENRLLWRMNRRRLEAEEIRDALLATSGRLDETMGGSLLQSKNHTYVTSTASSNDVNYQSRRRSVYLPVIRSAVYDVFSAFDFADPSTANGKRPATTVAPQALFMMNSALVLAESRALAERTLQATGVDESARVALLYRDVYGRSSTAAETARDLRFLARYQTDLLSTQATQTSVPLVEARLRAWQALARVLMSANEFVYVE